MQAYTISLAMEWAQQTKITGFSIPKSPVWHLTDIQHIYRKMLLNAGT